MVVREDLGLGVSETDANAILWHFVQGKLKMSHWIVGGILWDCHHLSSNPLKKLARVALLQHGVSGFAIQQFTKAPCLWIYGDLSFPSQEVDPDIPDPSAASKFSHPFHFTESLSSGLFIKATWAGGAVTMPS